MSWYCNVLAFIDKHFETFTGVSISSNCMRIQFLFQRHNFNVTDLLLKTVEQKVVTFFLWRFNKNRIREQLDDMRTPVMVRCNIFLLQSCPVSSESDGCENNCSRNGEQSKNLKVIQKVKMCYKFLRRNKSLCDQSVWLLCCLKICM